jgi:hypothetical protein
MLRDIGHTRCMKSIIKTVAALALALVVAYAPSGSAAGAPRSHTLFVITRSKNENIVTYDAQLTPDGGLDLRRPISAYWVLPGGRRESLNWLEAKVAYAFEVLPGARSDALVMRLVAFEKRPILVERHEGRFRAVTLIANRRSVLNRVYVKTDESGLFPDVQYIDLFGKADSTNVAVKERVVGR